MTLSYNQANFLSECILSVANQTVPPLEHLIFDPGSTDGSRDIAKQCAGATLFEETDSGQSDAVAKGMTRSKGDIISTLTKNI